MGKYLAKEEEFDVIKRTYKAKKFIDELGLTQSYVSQVFNRKRTIPKSTAFAFVKSIDLNANIKDYFEEV